MATIRIGTRRDEGGRDDRDYTYVGVLRQGRRVIAECGHQHKNRDHSSRFGGTSALDCITDIVRASRDQHFADQLINQVRTRNSGDGGAGFQVSAATLAEWRARDAADAAKLADVIAAVAALDVAWPPKPAAPVAPVEEVQEIGEMPEWMCDGSV
jgi:hypothetical protein